MKKSHTLFFYIITATIMSLMLGFCNHKIVGTAFAGDENKTDTPPSVGYTIVVDPGHGGLDVE